MRGSAGGVLIACLVVSIASAHAGSLSVTPVTISVAAPGAAATLNVSGGGGGVTAGQVRVLRWLQKNGSEELVATRDVVASPPALRLEPGREMTVRLVRTAKTPVVGEECYRVLVDQLPGADQDRIAVKFAIRHSIPLCFDAATQKRATIDWRLQKSGKSVMLVAHNTGALRAVAKEVAITATTGARVTLPNAVVLGGSVMSWQLDGKLDALQAGAGFTLTAKISGKPITVTGKVGGG